MILEPNTAHELQVDLVDATGAGLSGKVDADLTLKVQKGDGAFATYSLSGSQLIPRDGTNGKYGIAFVSGDFNVGGGARFRYTAKTADSLLYDSGEDYQVGTLTDDLATTVGTIATTATAIKAKTDNLPSDPASQAAIKGTSNKDLSQVDTDVLGAAGAIATAITDILAAQADLDARIGAPVGASLSADIQAMQSALLAVVNRILAHVGDNRYLRSIVRDSNGKPTQYLVEYYDSATHAATHDGTTGLVYKDEVDATYVSNLLNDFLQKRLL